MSDPQENSRGVHICFCSDDADLRPLAVAINSTMHHASRPMASLRCSAGLSS